MTMTAAEWTVPRDVKRDKCGNEDGADNSQDLRPSGHAGLQSAHRHVPITLMALAK
jgi:hypothetical protein